MSRRSSSPNALWRRVVARPSAVVALVFLVSLVAAVLLAPVILPGGPINGDLTQVRQLPSPQHLLGTDALGRDVLARILYGAPQSLGGAALATALAIVIGTPIGMLAGFFRGPTDFVASRAADIVQAMPLIVILMAVIGVFGNNQVVVMVTLGIALSVGFVRLARATTMSVRRALYVDAASAAGITWVRILARHVLPNIRGPLLVQATLAMSTALLIQAGLGFLGLGTPPPAPSWGGLITDAAVSIYQQPWLLVPSGLALIATILSFNFLGDALAEYRPGGAARARRGAAEQVAVQPFAHDPALPEPRDVAVSVTDLQVQFTDAKGSFSVVQGVSFDAIRGEALGIVGESGCGKSVTARSLLGLVARGGKVVTGSIVVDGQDIVKLKPGELAKVRGSRIALISQEPMVALDPSFTIGSQLRESIKRHAKVGKKEAHVRALALLAQVGIADPDATAASYTFQISGGMAQRAAIAMALTGDPDILVADEPTTALDVTVQAEILDLFRRLREERGMTMIIVTHDLGVVADSCDRVLVMYAGQVVESGRVDQILSAPRHPYTRGLLDSMPNRAVRGVQMRTIEGSVPAPRLWPVGCRFADRCAFAVEACRTAPIPAADLGEYRRSRCIRVPEIENELELSA